MKKLLIVLSLISTILLTMTLTGCNKDLIDTVYTFDEVILQLPDGTIIEGEVESWTDYEDGDQIQVKVNGTIYLVHSSNIVLINH